MTTPSEPLYREIVLTRGQVTIVDAADYDWLMQWNWIASCKKTQRFYALRRGGIAMHRQILGLAKGDRRQGDHIHGNTLDNRRSELRIVTQGQNQMNKATYRNNPLGLKGVRWMPREKKFMARIEANGERHSVGYYDTAEEAHAAYIEAAKRVHGEYARTL
jgi:hypothetical protein